MTGGPHRLAVALAWLAVWWLRLAAVAPAGTLLCGAVAAVQWLGGGVVAVGTLAPLAAVCGGAALAVLVALVAVLPAEAARVPDGAILPAVMLWSGAALVVGVLLALLRSGA